MLRGREKLWSQKCEISLDNAIRVRNRLLTAEKNLGILEAWEDQNDQRRAVGFIMC